MTSQCGAHSLPLNFELAETYDIRPRGGCFYGTCHPAALVSATVCDRCRTVVEIRCARPTCRNLIVDIEVDRQVAAWPECCQNTLDVRYVSGTGIVEVACSRCKKQLATFRLAGAPCSSS